MATERFAIFIDGGCGMCSREASWLRRLDQGRGRLVLHDIVAPTFDPSAFGIDLHDAMRTIHGRYPDGRIVTGLEVFRAAYDAVGYGWLWAPTGWPVIKPIADALYRVFARYRYRRRMRGCNNGQSVSPLSTQQPEQQH